jgi:hypothetical protein
MQNIKTMEAQVTELKEETRVCRDKTLDKLSKLYKILEEDTEEENSEENTASATAEAELGG